MSRPRSASDNPAWKAADPLLATVLAWWSENARELPWRGRRDIYAVWVSEVMSAQTTVGRSAEAWIRWMERWPTVESLAAASLTDVLTVWQGLGYPRRARDLHSSARVVAQTGWPEDLTQLPGVGDYTAAAIRCFALEQPILPLDVNVRRVLARRFPGGVDTSADPWRAGQAIMEFGQRICTARPTCELCPVREGCTANLSDAGEPVRRQARFEGSLRQRRGRLLRQVLSTGGVRLTDADPEAAAGLADDGLLVRADDWLRPPD